MRKRNLIDEIVKNELMTFRQIKKRFGEERINARKMIALSPRFVGWKNGRRLYKICFDDGTEKDYYIDFDSKTIEEY